MGRRGAIALVLVALAAGCGGGEHEEPFGDVSRADRIRFTDANNHIGRFWFENADWVKAANHGNVERARREFDGARDAVADARTEVDRMDNPKLRNWLGDYVATLEDYVDAGRRLMAAAERKRRVDRATEDRLIADVGAAAQRIERKERALVRFLSDYMPEEYLDEFRARFG
jgi:hypothetical protein